MTGVNSAFRNPQAAELLSVRSALNLQCGPSFANVLLGYLVSCVLGQLVSCLLSLYGWGA